MTQPRHNTHISRPLNTGSYEKENLFNAQQEKSSYEAWRRHLMATTGQFVSSSPTRAAKFCRIRGIVRAMAHTAVHRALSGKTRKEGLAAIAEISVIMQDEIERLYDTYNKNCGEDCG